MHKLLSVFWVIVGVAWTSAFAYIFRIAVLDESSPIPLYQIAILNALMAVLCWHIALTLALSKKSQKLVAVVFGALTAVHLLKEIAYCILELTSTDYGVLLNSLFTFTEALPTNSRFLFMPGKNSPLAELLLPIFSLFLLSGTWPFRSKLFLPPACSVLLTKGVIALQRYVQKALPIAWILVAACWISAFFQIGSMIGGMQWIAHMGMSIPATLNVLMALLFFAGSASLFITKQLPRSLAFGTAAVTSVHVFNAVGIYLLYSSNGRIFSSQPLLMLPFHVIGSMLPTNPIFTTRLVGNGYILALPLVSLALIIMSFRKSNSLETLGVNKNDS